MLLDMGRGLFLGLCGVCHSPYTFDVTRDDQPEPCRCDLLSSEIEKYELKVADLTRELRGAQRELRMLKLQKQDLMSRSVPMEGPTHVSR